MIERQSQLEQLLIKIDMTIEKLLEEISYQGGKEQLLEGINAITLNMDLKENAHTLLIWSTCKII